MTHKQTNYSFETSLPAYLEDPKGKKKMQMKVVNMVRQGMQTIREIADALDMPDSSVSGRISDAMKDYQVKYDGKIVYAGRLRKKIVAL